MADDRRTERQFVEELLSATRKNRVAWTGTVKPGCHQVVTGDYLVAISDEDGAPTLSLHHASGYRVDSLSPADFPAEAAGEGVAPLFDELLALARAQALGIRQRWRQVAGRLANPAPARPTPSAAPALPAAPPAPAPEIHPAAEDKPPRPPEVDLTVTNA